MRRLRQVTASLAAVMVLGACGESFRKELHDGFPPGMSIGVDGDEERNLRSVLAYYHVPPAGIDCMIEAVRAAGRFSPGSGAGPTDIRIRPTLTLTGEELNAYARGCGVDVATLWYTSD